ncbi:hypothetical protein PV797_21295 [Clostridiaceae bacterium M8S5]|nr:hypothetical protein PV797_21295 [Clostridiaceae bacterium M8S5]
MYKMAIGPKKIFIFLLCVISLFVFSSCTNNVYNLSYKEMGFLDKNLKITDANKINNILYEYTLKDIKQTLCYDSIDGVDYVISYITIGNESYFLGSSSYSKTNDLSKSCLLLSKTDFRSNTNLYKFNEIIGANYARTSYLTIKDNIPNIVMTIDGMAYEKDIDNDKKLETISEYGTPGVQTTIYKWDFENESVAYSYLNEAIFNYSPSVYINDKSQIIAYMDGKKEYYIIKNGKLHKTGKGSSKEY